MEKVVSGIRPTGNLHLGNYFGAVKSFVKMQDEYDCLFFIADWHSLTTHPKPGDIQQSARTILAEYLACGLDPAKAPIYVQSDVKETLELYLFFNMNMYIGELGRVTTFKEKARQQPDNVNAGLFTYPTLMAADILQHRATKVSGRQRPGAKHGDGSQMRTALQPYLRRRTVSRATELLLQLTGCESAGTRRQRQDGEERRQLHIPARR